MSDAAVVLREAKDSVMPNTLSLDNVSFHYGVSKKQRVSIFRNMSHQFTGGTFTAIMGPSGSGKTTLFRIISRELTPTEGAVDISGRDLQSIPDLELRRFLVARIYQEYRLVPFLSALDNVVLAQEVAGTQRKHPKRAAELLEQVGLSGLENSIVEEMSGGEQQRVAIARALVNDPAILLADEPTGALDEENTHAVTELLRQVAHEFGVIVIVATHDHLVAQAADDIFKISGHTLVKGLA